MTNNSILQANGRIPAIVDKTSGKPKRVFEGASMQLYLCEKYDKDHKISFPYDSDEYWETVEWLVWMVSSNWHCYYRTVAWQIQFHLELRDRVRIADP